jgi:peptidoglycan/LPS O-acetylase OafA/YrhL
VLAAWLSYRLLELPFLRAKRRFPLSAALPPQELQP